MLMLFLLLSVLCVSVTIIVIVIVRSELIKYDDNLQSNIDRAQKGISMGSAKQCKTNNFPFCSCHSQVASSCQQQSMDSNWW